MIPQNTYSISTWDHNEDGWHLECSGIRLMALRQHIRELLAFGYDWDVSILIEREPANAVSTAR